MFTAGSWRTFSRIYYSYRSVSERDLQPPVSLTASPLPTPTPPFVGFFSPFGANFTRLDELRFHEHRRSAGASRKHSRGPPGDGWWGEAGCLPRRRIDEGGEEREHRDALPLHPAVTELGGGGLISVSWNKGSLRTADT